MRYPWYYKELKEVKSQIVKINHTISTMSKTQEEKLDNYIETLQGSPNYELSESRSEIFNELVEMIEELINKLEEL